MSTTHKEEMQKLQAKQRAKVAAASNPNRGLILVHTGNGKGKSSSAFGVMVRALGWKQKVGVVQFIKGSWITGERRFFDQLGGIIWHTMGEGFTWDTQDRVRDIKAAKMAFSKAHELMVSGNLDLLILDEINIALRYDYLDVRSVIDSLNSRDKRTSIILTGRDAAPAICEIADLITEMTEIKHPFAAGIKAQRGIDF
ncbi:MAG: cob(I)yrinic acid a,c-diamide adenosyltransferase [Aestuariivita sp.]|nr:cob(I)yrinic acid a,c-diamide adenosyltransferase [Aestuariivita sp.]